MSQGLKHVLIIENSQNGLELNESNITYDKKGNKEYLLGGIFTEFDVMNRNERIYTADKFLPHLNEMIERKNSLGVIFGEFDHPDVFDVSLRRASHVIENVWFNQEKNRVDGQIKLLNTQWGKDAQAIVDAGYPLFVSSRAAGVTEGNGHVSVKKLFTYDAVADPGFGSAKMTSINESLGLPTTNNSNYRIYELTNESKFNDLIMDNKNKDFVTRNQMDDYSNYINQEIAKISTQINESVKSGNVAPEQITVMSETYDSLMEQQKKIGQYLDYLAEKMQFVFNENKELKTTTSKLIEHNDHLAENLNKSIKYSEYLAEKLDKNIDYSEYIAETLDKNIDFSEYIAEHVNKNIDFSDYLAESIEKSVDYSEYIAENLDDNIGYSEYLAENLDNNIAYSEYLAENLDSNIAYSEYLAENLDNNINYAEYIAEHVDNNIAYAEYIAEHVDNNIAYSEYIAENVSDGQAYMNYIAEGLDNTIEAVNGKMITEGMGGAQIPNMQQINPKDYYEEDDDFANPQIQTQTQVQAQAQIDGVDAPVQIDGQPVQAEINTAQVQDEPVQGELPVQGEVQGEMNPVQDEEIIGTEEQPLNPDTQVQIPGEEMPISVEGDELEQGGIYVDGATVPFGDDQAEILASNTETGIYTVKIASTGEVQEVHESKLVANVNTNQLTKQIQQLILETKKRKASEVKEPHFVQFLTEQNKKAWYDLVPTDKEKVVFAINESKKEIYSEAQLLNAISEALTVQVSDEELLVSNMPSSLVPVWDKLKESVKVSILSQAKLYPNLNNALKMEKFWESRNLIAYTQINETKTLINENKVVDSNSLSDEQIDAFISKLKNLG